MRWTTARANRCAYTQTQALADLRRAGVDTAPIVAAGAKAKGLSATEKEAMAFARKMTLAADTVTDDEVTKLIKTHGEKQVVAMVQLLAYANFQDRLILTLGLGRDEGASSPPLDVRFGKSLKGAKAVPRPPLPAPPEKDPSDRVTDPEWQALDFGALQKSLAGQRAREPRIRVPSWDQVKELIPPEARPPKALGIRWSLVCTGYQPELARAWSACTRAFGQESKQDRVLQESLFWVVTRSLHCFY
jgi:hypothetical protein